MTTQVKEAYTWCVTYEDGSRLFERETRESFSSVVTQQRVMELRLLRASGLARHVVTIPEGALPVFFRRGRVSFNFVENSTSHLPIVHCVGWKRGDDAVYLFVKEDEEILLTTDLQAV